MKTMHTNATGGQLGSAGRRTFLKGTGALVVAFHLPLAASRTAQAAGLSPSVPLNAVDSWLRIDGSGKVTLLSGKVELGTGIMTAYAQIVAEELDVPLKSVTVIQGDTAQTPDQGVTSASRSISVGGPQVRRAAAEARQALLGMAAERFGVPASELTVSQGIVSHGASRVSYAKLIGDQRFERTINEKVVLKKPADYKVVGTSARRVDIPGKVTADFTYIQDVRVPGMLHARVIRPAAIGATLVNAGTLPNRPKVSIVSKKNFLAVVAPTEWEAVQAARELKPEWSGGGGLPPAAKLPDTMRAMKSFDIETKRVGDVEAGLQRATKTLSATYTWPFQSHGSIGPSCAVADVRRDGTTTVWSNTQDVYMQREAVARLLGSARENVRIIFVEGSGCYGHNGSDDAIGDAALLSQEVGAPVRVQWMRHDEFGWAARGAPYMVDVKGGINDSGEVTAWELQPWAMTHSARYRHYGNRVSGYLLATQLSGGKVDVPLVAEKGKLINTGASGADRQIYKVANERILVHGLQTDEPHPLRPTEFRSVAGLGSFFASESFFDELAHGAGKDPLQFRLAHLTDKRGIEVLNAVAKLSKWESRASPNPAAKGQTMRTGRGVSFYAAKDTYVALVAEVEVDTASGKVRVTRVNVAHDCGLIINPDGLKNQIEGNAVQAVSRSLMEAVNWDESRVTSLDWQSYPILRFPDVPDVQVTLISRPDSPAGGAGEATTYPMAGAVGNAVFDAIGVRVRQGPFTPEHVKAALSASA
ncbi:MAG: putative isoquinoline 1-oxidoreductase subunit beta IorB, molybdoprotein [Noviherbaspirillum sp.]|nr:putative isoquinoline 1-oxidoreductase subunit beta IorB, molybdoprotein [Noviherbaspirillum sp.]